MVYCPAGFLPERSRGPGHIRDATVNVQREEREVQGVRQEFHLFSARVPPYFWEKTMGKMGDLMTFQWGFHG